MALAFYALPTVVESLERTKHMGFGGPVEPYTILGGEYLHALLPLPPTLGSFHSYVADPIGDEVIAAIKGRQVVRELFREYCWEVLDTPDPFDEGSEEEEEEEEEESSEGSDDD